MNIDDFTYLELSVEMQQIISADIANHFNIIPKLFEDDTYTFYIDNSNKNTQEIITELELILDKKVLLEPIETEVIQKTISIYYRKGDGVTTHESITNDFLEELIFNAKNINASDIHIEIYDDEARVRFRIDGHLIEKNKIDEDNYLELINKIKIKSNLDITEKRLPQDGRIEFDDFDIRVSILPTHYGEKVVMRILGRDASHLKIEALGFEEEDLQIYMDAVKKTNGVVLISGPTGSGKTTTLYATLKYLNDIKRNIVTVEDPIEYTLKGINQVQLKEGIGLTFSRALKSFLRQDPDIIMLGEIRDSETAQMAIRASLTGHLVLSTIHTNSAAGTISRLIDMGVPAFLLAETINISVAQRLLRLLCDSCKEEEVFDSSQLPRTFTSEVKVEKQYKAKGCSKCYFTGYKGRQAIYEMLPISYEVSNLIKKGENIENSSTINITRLSDKAFELFNEGKTSFEEIYPILLNI